jgi:hypothetical protein
MRSLHFHALTKNGQQLLNRILDTLFGLEVTEQRFQDVLAAYKRDLRNARVCVRGLLFFSFLQRTIMTRPMLTLRPRPAERTTRRTGRVGYRLPTD